MKFRNGYVLGDSLGEGVAQVSHLKGLARISVHIRGPRALEQFAQTPPNATVFLVLGTNDANDTIARLERHIDNIVQAAAQKNITLVWLGPPCVRPSWDSRARELDSMLRARFAGSPVLYVSMRDAELCSEGRGCPHPAADPAAAAAIRYHGLDREGPVSLEDTRFAGIRVVHQHRGALFLLAGLALVLAVAAASAGENEAKTRIAFVGNSLADGYWEGVTVVAGRDACLRMRLELGRFAKNSTGLTRPDRFDWAPEIGRIGEGFRPSLFVMSIGLNDRQSVVEHGQITMDNSPGYDDKYKERVTAVLKTAAASKASLLWVGLPAMRAAVTDKDTREKNRLYEEAIAAFGAPNIQYVEPWKLAATGADAFASFGPDQNGRMVQIRTPDGEHFTVAGEALTAVYLLPRILAILAANGSAPCAPGEGQGQGQAQ